MIADFWIPDSEIPYSRFQIEMEATIAVFSETQNKIPEQYKHCQKCGLSLGIVVWKDDDGVISIKFLANSGSVILNKNSGFHLRKSCIPADASADVNEVTNFVTGYSISKEVNRQREVEVSKCPICLSSIFCGDDISMVELPCKHMVCAQCMVVLFRAYQMQMGHGVFACPICKFNILHDIKEDVIRTTSATAPMAPPVPMSDFWRTKSSGITMSSLSAPAPCAPPPPGFHHAHAGIGGLHPHLNLDDDDDVLFYNPVIEESRFEQLRMEFFGTTNPVDAHQVMVDPETNPRIGSCLNVGCSCTTELVGSGYNDLVAYIFALGDDGQQNVVGHINFIHTHYENELFTVNHSGDFLADEGGFQLLKHFVLVKEKPSEPTGLHADAVMVPIDMPCDPSPGLMSTNYDQMKTENLKYLDRVLPMTGDDRRPRYVIIFAQVTYIPSQTLRSLSPHMAPSSGFLSTDQEGHKTVNACDWKNDNANMTAWGSLFIY